MKFTLDKTEQYTLVQVHVDKLDAIKTPQLKTEITNLNAEGVKNIILDLEDVKYVDSSGLSAVLFANRVCEAEGGILVLYGLSESVKKLIHIAQLDKVLNILPTKEEAIDRVFLHAIEADLNSAEE